MEGQGLSNYGCIVLIKALSWKVVTLNCEERKNMCSPNELVLANKNVWKPLANT